MLIFLILVHFVLQRSVLPATLCKIASPLAPQTVGVFHFPKTLLGLGRFLSQNELYLYNRDAMFL